MKKFAFALLIAAIAASPAAAQQKKAKKEAAAEPAPMAQPVEAPQPTQAQTTNQNSLNFAKDSLPVFLPSWSMPAYMAIQKPPQNQPPR
jgi:uncharacterized protein YdeI (BOF family)